MILLANSTAPLAISRGRTGSRLSFARGNRSEMEKIINIHIEKLPEGVYLATSDDVQGLIAQGRTVTETLEIARDVSRKLIEARAQQAPELRLDSPADSFNYPLIINA